MSDKQKNIILWVIIIAFIAIVLSNIEPDENETRKLNYSDFISQVDSGRVQKVTIDKSSGNIHGRLNDGKKFTSVAPVKNNSELLNKLQEKKIIIDAQEPEDRGLLFSIFFHYGPTLLFIAVWIYLFRGLQGGGKGFSFGKSRARKHNEKEIKVTFADVAGIDEAKEEVEELVDFLRSPEKYNLLGAKIPRGILLIGDPGTGKTLLAKAISGEAKCPFFSISGSDFVEMFVGVGAARVRDMFAEAKKNAPCIIFIDEIDAVGSKRGNSVGHDEREQTLNQLLVEMDGFEGNEGVIVIAATNRADTLDKALLRPGRFDRRVYVNLPDMNGRKQIIDVHKKKIPCTKDVDTDVIARSTTGFSGADLANIVNEAALLAARENSKNVKMKHFEKARDKIIMGVERRSVTIIEKERRNTAYHEAGHAITGLLSPEHEPVYKVSIIPRGQALGITSYLPEEDKHSRTKIELESRLVTLYGGRVAEEIIFGNDHVTTGAMSDIQRATDIAKKMVINWGLSSNMGPIYYEELEATGFGSKLDVSGKTHANLDEEVRSILDSAYVKATEILNANLDKLHVMAEALLKYETIDAKQVDDIMNGREVTENIEDDSDSDSDSESVDNNKESNSINNNDDNSDILKSGDDFDVSDK